MASTHGFTATGFVLLVGDAAGGVCGCRNGMWQLALHLSTPSAHRMAAWAGRRYCCGHLGRRQAVRRLCTGASDRVLSVHAPSDVVVPLIVPGRADVTGGFAQSGQLLSRPTCVRHDDWPMLQAQEPVSSAFRTHASLVHMLAIHAVYGSVRGVNDRVHSDAPAHGHASVSVR